jgi:hypothetical protein
VFFSGVTILPKMGVNDEAQIFGFHFSLSFDINSATGVNDEAYDTAEAKVSTSDPFLFFISSSIFIVEFQIYYIFVSSIYGDVASSFLTPFFFMCN